MLPSAGLPAPVPILERAAVVASAVACKLSRRDISLSMLAVAFASLPVALISRLSTVTAIPSPHKYKLKTAEKPITTSALGGVLFAVFTHEIFMKCQLCGNLPLFLFFVSEFILFQLFLKKRLIGIDIFFLVRRAED